MKVIVRSIEQKTVYQDSKSQDVEGIRVVTMRWKDGVFSTPDFKVDIPGYEADVLRVGGTYDLVLAVRAQ